MDCFLDPFRHDFANRFGIVQFWFLFEKPHRVALGQDQFPIEFLVHAGQYPEQGTFSGPIKT